MRTLPLYIACAVALALAAAGLAAVGTGVEPAGSGQDASTQQRGHGAGHTANWLRLRLQADGLYPGVRQWAPVRVRNRTRQRLVLRSVRPRVHGEETGCRRYLTIKRRKFQRVLPPRSVRRVKLRVKMSPAATDDCQGAKLPLGLRARATRR